MLTQSLKIGEHWLRTSDTRWKASSPRHATSVRASHTKTRGVPQAQLKPHVIQKKNSVHLFCSFVQHLYWYVLCASFTPPCSQRVRGGGIALLRYLARITLKSCAQKKGRNAKKNLSQVFLEFVHEFVSIINFLQSSVSTSVARHSRALVHTCLPQNRRQDLLVKKIPFWDFLRHFADPAQSSNSKLH